MNIPPHNIEAEQIVLGTMLLNSKTVPTVISMLAHDDFYKDAHSRIFEAIERTFKQSGGIDMVTIVDTIANANQLESCGGMSYIATLTNVMPSTANIKNHCNIIKEKSRSRKLITIASEAATSCYKGKPSAEVFADLSGYLTNTSCEDETNTSTVDMIMSDVLKEMEGRYDGSITSTGLSTGFIDLDRVLLGGFQKSDLIIVAGRPSMGKTTLAMNMVTSAAKTGAKIMVFSLEMSKSKLVEKQVSSISGVNIKNIQLGTFGGVSWPSLQSAAGIISQMNITIDDTGALDIAQIQARAKVEALKGGLDMIMVDYLQLAKAKANSREREVSEISAGLKALAKELKIPVVALSQLSRKCEERTDKRPLMSDLRDSGSLEQDADVIAFVYRDAVYVPDGPAKDVAEILIRKNRCGETGTVKLYTDLARCKFDNMVEG